MRENSIHLGIIVAHLSKHVNHLANDIFVISIRPLNNLHNSLVVVLTSLELASWDKNIVYECVFGSDKESHFLFHTQTTNKLVFLALQNLNNLSFLYMLCSTSHKTNLYPVAIKRKKRIALRHEDWFVAAIRNDRVLAVNLALEHTLYNLSRLVELITVFRNLLQKVVPSHLLHDVDGKHLQGMSNQF